jgi:hypothetical protein
MFQVFARMDSGQCHSGAPSDRGEVGPAGGAIERLPTIPELIGSGSLPVFQAQVRRSRNSSRYPR